MPQPLLECRSLTCGYGTRRVLDDVNLKLAPGEVVALLGPNGCGKSTLLKTLVKSLPSLRGEIILEGADLKSLSDAEVACRVAFVAQEERLEFAFLVREIVTMGRLPLSQGIFDTKEDMEAADAAMRMADCLHLADRPITELSGGEKQRVLIARALAQGSSLLLLDEPTSHLDVSHQLAVTGLVRRLAQEGRAILAAVHDLNLAAILADRALLIHEGRTVIDAPIEQVLTSPLLESAYDARFERFSGSDGRTRVYATSSTGRT